MNSCTHKSITLSFTTFEGPIIMFAVCTRVYLPESVLNDSSKRTAEIKDGGTHETCEKFRENWFFMLNNAILIQNGILQFVIKLN